MSSPEYSHNKHHKPLYLLSSCWFGKWQKYTYYNHLKPDDYHNKEEVL